MTDSIDRARGALPPTLSRRELGRLAGGVLALATTAGRDVHAEEGRMSGEIRKPAGAFPDGFVWGTATSSYQIEGAVNEDGRGASIWDIFSHTAGKIEDGTTGDVACDHYHRYKDDIGLIRGLGCKAYRFSIAWPRLFPDGTGTPNAKGLDFYSRLVDELLAQGITPYATLYHWDLPQTLESRVGGWRSTETAKAFGAYAGYIARHLGDRVKSIFTLNETGRFVPFGYEWGIDAPGLKLPPGEVNQIRHNVALAHGLAVQAIRAEGPKDIRVGPAENITACLPAIDTPENVRAAEIATRELNAGFLNVILTGEYTEAYLAWAGKNAPKFTADELKIIGQPIDFLGLNIYAPQSYIVASDRAPGFDVLPMPASFPHMRSDWLRVGPETAYWVPRLAAAVWKCDTIYITENGTSSSDEISPDGKIHDLDRVMYLRNYLAQLQRATAEGVPVKGYFLWSLMDNFEWIYGLSQRFGLYHVDFKTQKRTPKLSVEFYRNVIARNAIGA